MHHFRLKKIYILSHKMPTDTCKVLAAVVVKWCVVITNNTMGKIPWQPF